MFQQFTKINTLTSDYYDISNDRVFVRCYVGYLPTIVILQWF
jgi:hypothetical protein